MMSYWEQKYFTSYDTIIVGAGLSGLFTALFLKRKYPNERIIVISKGIISEAASTKNAGFACMGSITELEDDLSVSSEEEVVSLFEKRYCGLQIMREELGDQSIGYKENGSYELLQSDQAEETIDKISSWNDRLFSIRNCDAFSVGSISQFPFHGFGAVIHNELEGEIDTGKMYYTLRQKAAVSGIEFMTNTNISSFEKGQNEYHVFLNKEHELKTNRLILCTNAFTNDLLKVEKITPARAQVFITKPIEKIPFQGVYHFDRGYYYFREIDGRVLLGGGRQLDVDRETTDDFGMNELIISDLKTKLRENILVNTPFEIDYSWSGIMGKASSKEPISKQIDDQLFVLVGFGGMGVALAPFMAKELVDGI